MAVPVQATLGRLAILAVLLPAVLQGSEEAPEVEEHSLATCEAAATARRVREASREMADFVASGYADSHPAAVVLVRSMAEVSATLDAQLGAFAPAHEDFFEAWSEFDRLIRRSHLPRDPALRPVLPSYKHSVGELRSRLGCDIRCPAIPIAHLLAVFGVQIHDYLSTRHAESHPEQVAAAGELARTAKTLHQVLHDLEIAVPGTLGVFSALDTALAGSALTDTDEPQDVAVKTRLASLAEAIAALESEVVSCHESAEGHDHPL